MFLDNSEGSVGIIVSGRCCSHELCFDCVHYYPDLPFVRCCKHNKAYLRPQDFSASAREKVFHLGDLLSVTWRQMVSLKGPEAIRELVTHVTGTKFSDQSFLACSRMIYLKYPMLKFANIVSLNGDLRGWLKLQAERYRESEFPIFPGS